MNKPLSPFVRRAAPLLLALAAALPMGAHAHRAWMLPSSTLFSANEPWVSVDAAVSNDIFYFEHNALGLDNLVVYAPDGSQVKAENLSKGRYRSTFDVKLAAKGTYKLAIVNDGMMASYKLGTETKRVRGTAESIAKEIPAGAEILGVSQSASRMEVFVTSGKPSKDVLKPTNRGLELVPVTHPNDLVAGDKAKFGFILDGKPAKDIEVTVIQSGIRYRDKLNEQKYTSDAQGMIEVTWSGPGMYWLSAAPARPPGAPAGMGGPGGAGGPAAAGGAAPAATPPRPTGPTGTLAEPIRRASYTATLEVMPD